MKIIFWFNSTIFENCVCTCFPVDGATIGADANSFQFTVMPKGNFDRWVNGYRLGYDFSDITGFISDPEKHILQYGLYSVLQILQNKN